MPLQGLPENVAQVGAIEIAVHLSAAGKGISYGLDGMSVDEAIGTLVSVLDRLREERKFMWESCPCHHLPWGEHEFDEDDEEGDDDDEYFEEELE